MNSPSKTGKSIAGFQGREKREENTVRCFFGTVQSRARCFLGSVPWWEKNGIREGAGGRLLGEVPDPDLSRFP